MPNGLNQTTTGPNSGLSHRRRQHRRQAIGSATHPPVCTSARPGPSTDAHVHGHNNDGNSVKQLHKFVKRAGFHAHLGL